MSSRTVEIGSIDQTQTKPEIEFFEIAPASESAVTQPEQDLWVTALEVAEGGEATINWRERGSAAVPSRDDRPPR